MSRIGRKSITIPDGVTVEVKNSDKNTVIVKGKKGTLTREFHPLIAINKKGNILEVKPKQENKLAKSLWGLSRTLLFNMVEGVSNGFAKVLEIQGVGYKAVATANKITLTLGYSHTIDLPFPEGIIAEVKENQIIVSGSNKEMVGEFAAKIKSLRPVEPYKGKGIRYLGQRVKHKAGKAGKVGAK